MIELVLVYCLSAAPDRCLERHEPLEPSMTLIACSMLAQNAAQDYVRSHPAYQLKGWRCEMDKPRERPT